LGFSLCIAATGSHVPHESLDQVHAAFMPDAAWAVGRFLPDLSRNRLANPGFDAVPTISTRNERFTRVRLPGPHLTGSSPAFSSTLTTKALYRCSLRWFGAFPCRPAPKGLPSSPVQHRYLGNHLPSACVRGTTNPNTPRSYPFPLPSRSSTWPSPPLSSFPRSCR